jgi:hypothetical protein
MHEVEVDRGASQLGGASLHGGNKRACCTFATMIARNRQIAHA